MRIVGAHVHVAGGAGLDEAQKERVTSGTADELFPARV